MTRIAILGAGYAGLRCALDLVDVKQRGRIDASLELIDRTAYHQVVTRLHDVAADAMPPERARLPLQSLLPPDLITVVRADVERILPDEHRVATSAGIHDYDRLVIALGSTTAWPAIPGLRERAFPLRWWNEAVALRKHIRDTVAAAATITDRGRRRCHLRIVVAGGGFTGCQLAGELAHWLPDLADTHDVSVFDMHLMLLEQEDRLLPNWKPWSSRRAERILTRKGVDVRVNSPLRGVDGEYVSIGDEQVCTHTLVWTGGIRAPAVLAESGLPVGEQGRVIIDDFLRVPSFPEIFVAGDCALVMRDGEPVPANASYALRQGAYVARTLVDEATGREIRPYRPVVLGMLVSLGNTDAVGDVLGLPVFGWPAGAIREGVERWYLSTVQ